MPFATIAGGAKLHYVIDDYTDPWRSPETVLLLHGAAESGAAWFGWVPHLARRYRVVRPDMRGFGASSAMPRDFPWTLDLLVEDFVTLMRTLGVDRFHVIGAKIGGTVARHFAASHPELVRSLTVAGTPPPRRKNQPAASVALVAELEQSGAAEAWARRTMAGRLGREFPESGTEWWINLMGRTEQSTLLGFVAHISGVDITGDLPRITCPTLVITTEGSALGSVDETRAWQMQITNSRLVVLPGDSYHVAASDPDRCAREALAFMDAVSSAPSSAVS